MQKTISKEEIKKFLGGVGMKYQSKARRKLVENLHSAIMPYIGKGIADADDELDFCSTLEMILDDGGMINPNERVKVAGQIYDHLGFTHFWKG